MAVERQFAAASFGGLELLAKLSAGGMGEVLLARRRGAHGFEKLVAVKTIRGDLARREDMRKLFLDEARLMARLDHPNIAQVHDFGETNELLYLAMEYVPGLSLSRLAKLHPGPVPPEVAARIVAEVCRGLHAAHELTDLEARPLNVVHRDVSPQNVMITFDGRVKILDFGIALRRDREAPDTDAGFMRGKISYAAPEQISGEAIDRRTDVYGAAIVLHELLTGKRLFTTGATPLAELEARRRVPPPSARVAGIPPPIEAVAQRGLVFAPSSRFQDARTMAAALEQAIASAPGERLEAFAERILADERRAQQSRIQALIRGAASDERAPAADAGEAFGLRMLPGPPPPQVNAGPPAGDVGREPGPGAPEPAARAGADLIDRTGTGDQALIDAALGQRRRSLWGLALALALLLLVPRGIWEGRRQAGPRPPGTSAPGVMGAQDGTVAARAGGRRPGDPPIPAAPASTGSVSPGPGGAPPQAAPGASERAAPARDSEVAGRAAPARAAEVLDALPEGENGRPLPPTNRPAPTGRAGVPDAEDRTVPPHAAADGPASSLGPTSPSVVPASREVAPPERAAPPPAGTVVEEDTAIGEGAPLQAPAPGVFPGSRAAAAPDPAMAAPPPLPSAGIGRAASPALGASAALSEPGPADRPERSASAPRPGAVPAGPGLGDGPERSASAPRPSVVPSEPGPRAGDGPGALRAVEGPTSPSAPPVRSGAAPRTTPGPRGAAPVASAAPARPRGDPPTRTTQAARTESDARPHPRAAPAPRRQAHASAVPAHPPRGAQPGYGVLAIDATPPAQVVVDGRVAGMTPLAALKLAPGRHEVQLRKPGTRVVRWRKLVTIRDGQRHHVSLE